ncbi:hypothetical protein KKB68_00410, partial [Patescibacteria group bacterium]|nr:hypothetical protein [Patescibacteria group bacterium]
LLVITVWDLNPFKMILTKKWKRLLSFLKYTSLKMFTISKLDFKDFFVPWGKTALRYLHYFTKNELGKLVLASGFKIKEIKTLERVKSKENNILLVVIK